MKLLLTSLLPTVLLIFSCSSPDSKSIDSNTLTSELFKGFYLVDDVFFPQDTLVMRKFQLSDSTTREKLLLQFKNDSLYLSNYNFGGWYGKWFCGFRSAKAKFNKDRLAIGATVTENFFWCKNENIWQKLDYQLVDSTDHSFTLIKTLDSSNCIAASPFRNVQPYLGRGGRDFTDEGGERIRSDIQLR